MFFGFVVVLSVGAVLVLALGWVLPLAVVSVLGSLLAAWRFVGERHDGAGPITSLDRPL